MNSPTKLRQGAKTLGRGAELTQFSVLVHKKHSWMGIGMRLIIVTQTVLYWAFSLIIRRPAHINS